MGFNSIKILFIIWFGFCSGGIPVIYIYESNVYSEYNMACGRYVQKYFYTNTLYLWYKTFANEINVNYDITLL